MRAFFTSPIKVTSLILVTIGVALLALNIILDWTVNIALPLVFLVLSGGFFLLEFQLRRQWPWAAYLYIVGGLLGAFGIIFLLDVLTQDWNSWAYAWLFLIVGAGIGLLLANIEYIHKPAVHISGWGMVLGGITFFAIFGAITGGLFIQIFAPILLVTAGLSLRWLHLERILPLFQKPGNPETMRSQRCRRGGCPDRTAEQPRTGSADLDRQRVIQPADRRAAYGGSQHGEDAYQQYLWEDERTNTRASRQTGARPRPYPFLIVPFCSLISPNHRAFLFHLKPKL